MYPKKYIPLLFGQTSMDCCGVGGRITEVPGFESRHLQGCSCRRDWGVETQGDSLRRPRTIPQIRKVS